MREIAARAATRVDLAGGSLDLWPLGLNIPGALTVNVAISPSAKVRCTRSDGEDLLLRSEDLGVSYSWSPGKESGALPLVERHCAHYGISAGWQITTDSESPPGGGIGGSSALSVALSLALGALTGRRETHPEVVAVCRDLEAANLGIPTGVQDFWPALMGGVLSIRYLPGMNEVERLDLPLKALAERLVVVYSGESHLSSTTNWSLIRSFIEGNGETREALIGIAGVAAEMKDALTEGDLDGAGRLLGEEWEFRRKLAPGISTPRLEGLGRVAIEKGAAGWKACGAGGGGCLAIIVKDGARREVQRALEREGAQVLVAHPVERGHTLEVIE